MYQELKLQELELTGLSSDSAHIYAGLLVFFWAVALRRKGKLEAADLIPVLS
jgi:hypothetical protein